MDADSEQIYYQPGFMDLSPYSLVPAELGIEWDNVVRGSEQGSIFCLTDFLSNLGESRPRTWYCLKGRETKAAVALLESKDGKRCVLDGTVVHHGIMLAPPQSGQSNAQTIAENFRVTTCVVNELTQNQGELFISTHPNFTDIRPFLWHNYETDGPKFDVDVRYTSLIDLQGITGDLPLNSNPVYLDASKSRRQEIRYGIQKGVETSSDTDVGQFIDFYNLTFRRQDVTVNDRELQNIESLVQGLLSAGLARMYLSKTAAGEPGSMALIGIDNERAYFLFGANDPALRDQHTGTMVLWDAFLDLASRGVRDIDLEGVNSPLRGHFKLSFGGSMTPYYHLSLGAE